MMAFFMHFLKKSTRPSQRQHKCDWYRGLRYYSAVGSVLCLLECTVFVPLSQAAHEANEAARVHAASDVMQEQGKVVFKALQASHEADKLLVYAQPQLELSSELIAASNKGVPLYLKMELQIYRPRWYWTDEVMYSNTYNWRIQYNALLRQWTVSENGQRYTEYSLADCLQHINTSYSWTIALAQDLPASNDLKGRIRLFLDSEQLPNPFKINTLLPNSAWSLSSAWNNFDFQSSAVIPAP